MVSYISGVSENAIGVAACAGSRRDGTGRRIDHCGDAARIDAIGVARARGLGRHGAGSRIGQGSVAIEGVNACGLARSCGGARNSPAVAYRGRVTRIQAIADPHAAGPTVRGGDAAGVGAHRGVSDCKDAKGAAAIGQSRNGVGV